MSIDNIAGFLLGKDRITAKTQTQSYPEPGLQSIPSNKPIAENPDNKRQLRNKLAEFSKQKAA